MNVLVDVCQMPFIALAVGGGLFALVMPSSDDRFGIDGWRAGRAA